MKSYTVGREHTCNIILQDPQKIISRTHAIINVADNGKITIVDQSTNGTYVNGMRISSNVPVPVTRKDKVSFAHVASLDWSQVPGGFSLSAIPSWIIGMTAGAAIVLVLAFLVPWNDIFSSKRTSSLGEPISTPVATPVENPSTSADEEVTDIEDGDQEAPQAQEAPEQTPQEVTPGHTQQEVTPGQTQSEVTTEQTQPEVTHPEPVKEPAAVAPKKTAPKKNNTGGATGTSQSQQGGSKDLPEVDEYEIPD